MEKNGWTSSYRVRIFQATGASACRQTVNTSCAPLRLMKP